eukprot:SAG31_NODE_1389_length_8545_cov_3.081103_2_plen_88_part_00
MLQLLVRGVLDPVAVKAAITELQRLIWSWPERMPASYARGRTGVGAEGRLMENPGTPLVDIDPSILSGQLKLGSFDEPDLAVRRDLS